MAETIQSKVESVPDSIGGEQVQATTNIRRPADIVECLYADTLKRENYEEASVSLANVEALQHFRNQLKQLPFGSFHDIVESITNLDKLHLTRAEKEKQARVVIEALGSKAGSLSPRVADLYLSILANVTGDPYEPAFAMTGEKIKELRENGDLKVLFSGEAPWEMKINRIETRLIDYLSGARSMDKREGNKMDEDIRQWRQKQLEKEPDNPPERRHESKPSVDAMERLKEGERAPSLWSIHPAWGGYYKEQSFSRWDNQRNVWVEDQYSYSDVIPAKKSGNAEHTKGPTDITMHATASAGRWLSIPIPYTHHVHLVEAGGRAVSVQQDQNGDIVLLVNGSGHVDIQVMLAPDPDKKPKGVPTVPDMPAVFSQETNDTIAKIERSRNGNMARAQAMASYVISRIRYLAPKDAEESQRYNQAYNTHPNGFAGAVDELKAADCDVANTYFAALCAKLNIPVRHVVGHSVKGKDETGASNINSGTGHGWSEVWDDAHKNWVRIDATPPGDPNLQEDQPENSAPVPGDYGIQEAMRPTDEQLENLRQKLAEHSEKLSYTREERELAQATGVDIKEARQIMKEIHKAEQTRLPNGESVVDALSKLFNAIIESRRSIVSVSAGPVRRREGGERIEDIVRHKIGIVAGETDPLSRARPEDITTIERNIGGFDVYLIGDKSGSMQSDFQGEQLWAMQRRAEYLIFSALHRFERNVERAGLGKEHALSIRTQGLSFRGSEAEDIDEDKPLSARFDPQDKVKLWHSLTEAGSGNGDVQALSYVYEQIQEEIAGQRNTLIENDRLRIVIACSDGGYIGNDAVEMRQLAENLSKLNVIVVGVGLTPSAANVPVVMDNPPYSRGDIARTIDDLPLIVAKHVVLEAIKLFPRKTWESAKNIIEDSISKFQNLS